MPNLIPQIGEAFGGAAFIWLLSRAIHLAVTRNSEHHRYRGMFIPEWIAVSVFASSVMVPISAGFGLLFGLVVGNIHGLIRVTIRDRNLAHLEQQQSATLLSPTSPAAQDSPNPYASPKPVPDDLLS